MNGGTVSLQNPGLMTYTGSVTIGSGFNSTFNTSGSTSQIKLSGNLTGPDRQPPKRKSGGDAGWE